MSMTRSSNASRAMSTQFSETAEAAQLAFRSRKSAIERARAIVSLRRGRERQSGQKEIELELVGFTPQAETPRKTLAPVFALRGVTWMAGTPNMERVDNRVVVNYP